MLSRTAEAVKLRHRPLALYRSDGPAPGARRFSRRTEFRPSNACSLALVAAAFREGTPCAFSTETVHCPGGHRGFGLRPPSWTYPGGIMGTLRLVSCGNRHTEEGRAAVEELRAAGASEARIEQFAEGEGFKRSPELLREAFGAMPSIPPSDGHVNVVPLADLDDPPEVVIFLADPQQISALVTLAGYSRPGFESARVPFCAGCTSIALFPLAERSEPQPRAIIGLIDVYARMTLRSLVGREYLTFSMPWELYAEMEGNVAGSFLERRVWRGIA
ncbi:MAG: DUF169 domain-containing protein [Deltaproteobacteria bacterium]|jgi:uncharacterized protein (DUF169 family)|nr:DUF169 domain-containing protein [Deltaproteobacteria bacterium]